MQDHILIKAFGGSYGSEKEASIEEYVDKMKEFRKNILNTKAQLVMLNVVMVKSYGYLLLKKYRI